MVVFYKFKSHVKLKPVKIYIRTIQGNGSNIYRPPTDSSSLPRLCKRNGRNMLTSCKNKHDREGIISNSILCSVISF